jgi:transposase
MRCVPDPGVERKDQQTPIIINRGGNRQANATLHRVIVVRMRAHQPTIDYVKRRTIEGTSKPEIIRCLKRFLAREIFGYLCRPSGFARRDEYAA